MAGGPYQQPESYAIQPDIDYMKLNRHLIGEMAQFALYSGALGKPRST